MHSPIRYVIELAGTPTGLVVDENNVAMGVERKKFGESGFDAWEWGASASQLDVEDRRLEGLPASSPTRLPTFDKVMDAYNFVYFARGCRLRVESAIYWWKKKSSEDARMTRGKII